VLLGGCGLYDGSDVHETVFVLLALEAAGERPVLLAPDRRQARTVDHLTGAAVEGDDRNVLQESARLSRGAVRTLSEYPPAMLEALVIPGGYGPVVNLATGFAEPGTVRSLHPEVAALLGHFLEEGKPVGLVGLGEVPVRMLLGQEVNSPATPAEPATLAIDPDRSIVHTPGFASFTRLDDVRTGIEAMITEVLRRMEARAQGARPAAGGNAPRP
jgi:enhancing lycopene biosynthesis protein 2